FPSLTDTFGLVLLEAMACGVPVAAYPVTGPIDVVQQGKTGVLDSDLRQAVFGALKLEPANCVAYARQHSWRNWTERVGSLLEPFEKNGGERIVGADWTLTRCVSVSSSGYANS